MAKKQHKQFSKNEKIYAEVTDRIIASLKQGVVPWQKPWKIDAGMDGLHRPMARVRKDGGVTQGKPYRGVNQFLLSLYGYECQTWATKKNIEKCGGKISKGEKPAVVVFWNFFKVIDRNDPTGKRQVFIPFLREFEVFNLEQQEGIELPTFEKPEGWNPIEDAERTMADMPFAPRLRHSAQDRAYYTPTWDEVHLPIKEAFPTPENYYNTAFHELAHATGHESRLNRKELMSCEQWGDATYSEEELTAEMTAAFVNRALGLQPQIEQSAAYIKSWLRKLQDDPKMVINASARAQKAADWILGQLPEAAQQNLDEMAEEAKTIKPVKKPKAKTTKKKQEVAA